MKFKKPNKKEAIVLVVLISLTAIATYAYGSRGFLIGTIFLYINATIELIRQLFDAKNALSRGRKVGISIYFCLATVLVFYFLFKILW